MALTSEDFLLDYFGLYVYRGDEMPYWWPE